MASLYQDGESQLLVQHLEEVEQQLEQEEDELLVNHTVEVEEEISMVQHLDKMEQEVEDDMSLLEHLEEIEEDLALVSHMEDIDQQPEQQGGGAAVPAYYLRRVVRQRARRFRANAVNFNVQFNPEWLQQQRLEELPQALRDQFDNIIQELRLDVNGQDNDRIGLALHHPGLNVPIRIPFRRLGDLRGEDVMQMVEKVHQSNDNARIDAAMDIEFLHVEDPDRLGEGRGHRSKHSPKNLATFLERKQCIVRIKNEDDLCFARAVVVGLHYARKPVPFQRLEANCKAWDTRRTALTRTNRADVQKEEAINLFRDIGVEPGPCLGRETWTVFSEHLAPEYQLKVYSQEVYNKLLFKSEVVNPSKIIHLYHHNSHYDVITSMTAFTGYSEYCEDCDVGFNNKEDHRCTREFRCHQCRRPGYCGKLEDEGIPCLDCRRWFPTTYCYQRHKETHTNKAGITTSTCLSLHRCSECNQEDNAQKHTCSEKRSCKNCKEPLTPKHRCYVTPTMEAQGTTPNATDPVSSYDKQKFIFYDFECQQETGVHVPNLCVVHLGCGRCMGSTSTELCEGCPWRKEDVGPSRSLVFRGDNTLEEMGGWLLSLVDKKPSKKRKRGVPNLTIQEDQDEDGEEVIDEVLVIAHNYRGYDGHLLLQYFNKHLVVAPQIVLRGQQILMMKVGRLTFKDSLNFLSIPLKEFPDTFGLSELSKGYFPHFFNTKDNSHYVGAYPPMETYGHDSMSSEERKTFIIWYTEKVSANASFNMSEDILSYCQSDVDILRRGCAAFRDLFISLNNVDPFLEATTLPMACMLVFRKNYLEPKTIAIIPPHGYRPERRYSIQCLQWLKWVMLQNPNLKIEHARNGGEATFQCLDGSRYSVDGYDRESKTVFEFMGCFWHGCTKCYKAARCDPHPTLGTTMREVHQATLYRLAVLNQHKDVAKIVQIWECEFKDSQKTNPDLREFIGGFEFLANPLDPRDAFFGGRTNATKLYYSAQEDEEIKYVDVCSLYPYICKYGKFPLGHPSVVDHPPVSQLNQLEGLIQCRILPPSQLYHPLLPYRTGGKLMFPLCRTCADGQLDVDCGHSDEERAWVGTYTTIEVQTAVRECGYRVLHIFEAWHFDTFSQYCRNTHEGGLFAKYVDNFFKIKQEASGLPKGCTDPQNYVNSIYEKEGVRLDLTQINDNRGLRSLAKGCLNNHWGKFGQRLGFGKASYVTEPSVFFAMLRDDRHEVKDVLIVNENMLFVSTEPRKDFHTSHPASNVVIAAWVTAQARLKLFSYLTPLERRVLYFDTDSIIYVHKPDVWNPTLGDTLGDLTDELHGNTISTFVSGGPKNYAYRLNRPAKDGSTTKCKIRGFTLNYSASQHVNFDSMKALICDGKGRSISVDYPNRIIRQGFKQGNQLMSVNTAKRYRMVYTKRRVLFGDDEKTPVDTLPYGWKN